MRILFILVISSFVVVVWHPRVWLTITLAIAATLLVVIAVSKIKGWVFGRV